MNFYLSGIQMFVWIPDPLASWKITTIWVPDLSGFQIPIYVIQIATVFKN